LLFHNIQSQDDGTYPPENIFTIDSGGKKHSLIKRNSAYSHKVIKFLSLLYCTLLISLPISASKLTGNEGMTLFNNDAGKAPAGSS